MVGAWQVDENQENGGYCKVGGGSDETPGGTPGDNEQETTETEDEKCKRVKEECAGKDGFEFAEESCTCVDTADARETERQVFQGKEDCEKDPTTDWVVDDSREEGGRCVPKKEEKAEVPDENTNTNVKKPVVTSNVNSAGGGDLQNVAIDNYAKQFEGGKTYSGTQVGSSSGRMYDYKNKGGKHVNWSGSKVSAKKQIIDGVEVYVFKESGTNKHAGDDNKYSSTSEMYFDKESNRVVTTRIHEKPSSKSKKEYKKLMKCQKCDSETKTFKENCNQRRCYYEGVDGKYVAVERSVSKQTLHQYEDERKELVEQENKYRPILEDKTNGVIYKNKNNKYVTKEIEEEVKGLDEEIKELEKKIKNLHETRYKSHHGNKEEKIAEINNNEGKQLKQLKSKRDNIVDDYDRSVKDANKYAKNNYGKSSWRADMSGLDNRPPLNFRSPLKHPAEDSNLEGYKEGLRHAHPNGDESWKWVADGAPDDAKPHRNTPTSPFSRRDRSHLNVRKKWTPNQGTPMMHRSPFHQEIDPNQDPMANQDPTVQNPEEMAGIEGQEMQQPQGETVWDKMKMYGDSIETQVDKFVSNASYNSGVDKPIKAIQNQEWVGRITEWLKEKKGQLVQAKKSKNKDAEQKINQSVQSLVGDITTYAGKFEEWMTRNGGDETPGNQGGNMTSEGSSKDKRFEADLAFVGDPNTSMDITEEGKMGVKSYGLEDLKYVDELDTDVFIKDFKGYQQMLEMSSQLQEDAESGRPLNKNIIGGQADMLLANKDSLLSWAHDPLYGQAWIQDYAQGNPGENLDWAMPESDQFDKDRLEDEVHGWLTDKLTQAYTKYAPKDAKDAEGIKEETMASIDQGGYSKNTPMAYKQNQTKAQQLIAKYS